MRLFGLLGWGRGAAFQDYGRPNKKRRGEKKLEKFTEAQKTQKGSRRKWVREEDGTKMSTKEGRKGGGGGGKGASTFACSTHVV